MGRRTVAVDVVVPFRGGDAELRELCARLERLRLREGDSLVVADNTPGPARSGTGKVRVVHAAELPTPAHARNRGVAQGSGDWLVFIDADAVPAEDLLDRYFDPPPGERTALLAGGVEDEPVPPGGPPAARYAYLRGAMSQEDSLGGGDWAYPKTANAACRRAAFEEVGGFRGEIRAAEDADLTYRLKAAGWEVERREGARVLHRNRRTLAAYARQKLIHGAGGAWLNREYPGSVERRGWFPGVAWWGLRAAVTGLIRARDREAAVWALYDPLEVVAWELGRSLPNVRPLRRALTGRR